MNTKLQMAWYLDMALVLGCTIVRLIMFYEQRQRVGKGTKMDRCVNHRPTIIQYALLLACFTFNHAISNFHASSHRVCII